MNKRPVSGRSSETASPHRHEQQQKVNISSILNIADAEPHIKNNTIGKLIYEILVYIYNRINVDNFGRIYEIKKKDHLEDFCDRGGGYNIKSKM
jgi:hypothetical protein